MILFLLPNNKSGGAEKAGYLQWNFFKKHINSRLIYIFNDHPVPKGVDIFCTNASIRNKIKAIIGLRMLLKGLDVSRVICHLSSIYYYLFTFPSREVIIEYYIHTKPSIEIGFARLLILKVFILFGYDVRFMVLNLSYKKEVEGIFKNGRIFSNIVSFEKMENKHEGDKVLAVGRFDPVKNFNELPAICKLFAKKAILITHRIGEHGGYYEKEVALLKNNKNIEVVENVNTFSGVMNFASGCKYIVVLSDYEGLPTVLIEAAYLGLIPICRAAPGTTDFIESLNIGWLKTHKTLVEMREFHKKLDGLESSDFADRANEYYVAVNSMYGKEAVEGRYRKEYGF